MANGEGSPGTPVRAGRRAVATITPQVREGPTYSPRPLGELPPGRDFRLLYSAGDPTHRATCVVMVTDSNIPERSDGSRGNLGAPEILRG